MNIRTRVRWMIEDLREIKYRYGERIYAGTSLICFGIAVLTAKSVPVTVLMAVAAGTAYLSGYARAID